MNEENKEFHKPLGSSIIKWFVDLKLTRAGKKSLAL